MQPPCRCTVAPRVSRHFVVEGVYTYQNDGLKTPAIQARGCKSGSPKGYESPGLFLSSTCQPECLSMEQNITRKTYNKSYKYKLMPMQEQEQALETVVLRCRTLYNCALEQRKTWWGRGQGIGVSYYQHAMELPDLKADCPEYGEVYSQVLQDVLRRVDTTYHAFFLRVKNGETPGYPRFQGRGRYTS